MRAAGPVAPRGTPLAMMVLLIGAWSGARALMWENPLAQLEAGLGSPPGGLAQAGPAATPDLPLRPAAMVVSLAGLGLRGDRKGTVQRNPQRAAGHSQLRFAALGDPFGRYPGEIGPGQADTSETRVADPRGPFLPSTPANTALGGRWSLDVWTFWRQGSDSAPISQGRVPIYGASQTGGVLQYRLAPASQRDPRLYVRAYQALVPRGESEVALGASARPFGRVPVRVAGEVRYTDGAFGNSFRPAAYAVTELAPIRLPYDALLEAYGQAGWVGGASATPFAEGQASVTRELPVLAGLTDNRLRLRLGAAAWGGAQEDAQRIDVGPTMRLDFNVGAVPARVSVDWRERVGGDASPGSGVAATLSTSF